MAKSAETHVTQIGVRLPAGLHERLIEAAGDRGVSDEVRKRLEASFAGEPAGADPATMQFVRAIVEAASYVSSMNGDRGWAEDGFSFTAFETALGKVVPVALSRVRAKFRQSRSGTEPGAKHAADPNSIWAQTQERATPEGLGYAAAATAIAGLRK
jgi:hypothetical protein